MPLSGASLLPDGAGGGQQAGGSTAWTSLLGVSQARPAPMRHACRRRTP